MMSNNETAERETLVDIIDDVLQQWNGDSSACYLLADAVIAAGWKPRTDRRGLTNDQPPVPHGCT